MPNQFGRTSKLKFMTVQKENRTELADLYFTAPFKIMSPFRLENGGIRIMPLMASAGIMEGDVHNYDINIKAKSNAELVSQSFEKVHKMKQGKAVRHAVIHLEEETYFHYNPLPLIPFADSAYENKTDVYLKDDSSRFILTEILSAGRTAFGERFQYRFYHSLTNIWRADKLIYRDNTRYDPGLYPIEGLGFFEGYTHFAGMVLCGFTADQGWMEQIRTIIGEAELTAGAVTRLQSGDLAVRILGNQAQQLQELCSRIAGSCPDIRQGRSESIQSAE